jgi:hypothetical protein
MFEERLASARAARARLLDEIGTLTADGPDRGPYRAPARPPDQELKVARAEADVRALECHLRNLRARRHRGLRPSRVARLLVWVVVVAMAGLAAVAVIGAALAAVGPPAAPPTSDGYERRVSFTGRRPPESCLANARALLGRMEGAGRPLPVWTTPYNLRAYTWQALPYFDHGPPSLEQVRQAAADDSDWRYAIDVRAGFGRSRVTLVGHDKTCAVEPNCFAGPRVRCFPLHDPARLEQEMAILEAYLRASC